MRHIALLLPLALVLAGCESCDMLAPQTAPCAPRFDPCAPQATYGEGDILAGMIRSGQVGAEYRVGAREQARAVLAVPPQVVGCLVTGGYEALMAAVKAVNCVANNLIPAPVPSLYVRPVAPAAAAPCAPATVMVEEEYDDCETIMVPQTRTVKRTRMVARPVAPAASPCAPPAAAKPCP